MESPHHSQKQMCVCECVCVCVCVSEQLVSVFLLQSKSVSRGILCCALLTDYTDSETMPYKLIPAGCLPERTQE